jgi:A/G-specific adenine glycosylase
LRDMDSDSIQAFRDKIWEYYRANRRDFVWRSSPTPYIVFVSEVMLQQTQVDRVSERLPLWLSRFPGFADLAEASVKDVLGAWSGLGYNRRALWLRESAQMIMNIFDGVLPRDPAVLTTFRGVGANTAGSIAAFVYNMPVVFIETNIRRVFIHEFFPSQSASDADLMPYISASLDRVEPREWYYALMDAGANLAKRFPNPNRRSMHYSVQSRFEGSTRQVRGKILRQLAAGDKTVSEMGINDVRLPIILVALIQEGFLTQTGEYYGLLK